MQRKHLFLILQRKTENIYRLSIYKVRFTIYIGETEPQTIYIYDHFEKDPMKELQGANGVN